MPIVILVVFGLLVWGIQRVFLKLHIGGKVLSWVLATIFLVVSLVVLVIGMCVTHPVHL